MLDLLEGSFELADNSGETVISRQLIAPCFALRAGRRHDANGPLVPPPVRAMADA